MKLQEAIEIGKECGLETIEECINNVTFHSTSFFAYDELEAECDELYEDLKKQYPDIYKKMIGEPFFK